MLWRCYWPGRRARPSASLGGRNRRLGVLLGSGSERLRRSGRAVLPEEPAYVSERDLDLLGVRLPRVQGHLGVRREIDALHRDDVRMGELDLKHLFRQASDALPAWASGL